MNFKEFKSLLDSMKPNATELSEFWKKSRQNVSVFDRFSFDTFHFPGIFALTWRFRKSLNVLKLLTVDEYRKSRKNHIFPNLFDA